jgi:putative transposase
MTADSKSIDLSEFMVEHLQRADPDLLRSMLKTFVEALMGAEADGVCGAEYGARSPGRINSRNGYRSREWDTRAGTVELALPKLRSGSYFPEWLLERRKRAEKAMISVVATCYLLGVSTRRMEKLVEQLGITRLSKSQVSVMARELDEQVESFRTRPLDQGPYTFVAADALTMKVREGGRVVNVAVMIATGVNIDGHREVLGIDVCSAESAAGWLSFFRGLVARGLTGQGPVALVTSDAHNGLVAAVQATLPGASWQRCRTHYAANLMSATPQEQLGMGQGPVAQRLRPTRRGGGAGPVRPRRRRLGREAPHRRRTPRNWPRRHPRLHRLPARDLATDLVQQPQREAQP